MNYTLAAIQEILGSIPCKMYNPDLEVIELAYDSRKIRDAAHSLFFALKHIRDGHRFIPDAYQKGVRAFVLTDEKVDISSYPEANFLYVADALQALQKIASFHRQQFKQPVIGITGSNGKTIVKEWLTQLLQDDKKVYQSPKSYNSQLGVALSLWNLSNEYDVALIEAGISQPGEMSQLENMIKPDIGIFTNIGIAHAEGFASKEQKIKEKMQLFQQSKELIYASRYQLEAYLSDRIQSYTYGETAKDQLQVLAIEKKAGGSSLIRLRYQGAVQDLHIPFIDKASIENILLCTTVLLYMGYPLSSISSKLQRLRPLEMRMQLKTGRNNCSIIDDTYSNDLASLQIALDFLQQQQQHQKKTLILSDMEGMNEALQAKLLSMLKNQQLSRLIFVGPGLYSISQTIQIPSLYFSSTDELLAALTRLDFENESILIKGGRKYHLEDVSKQLVAKSHETVLEINLSALEHNLQAYRSKLPPGVQMMAMVKAFSYGSGSFEVANLLQFNKVDYLTVAFADEGVELRQHGISLPIMVLSPDEQVFENLLTYQLEPEIYSFRILESLITFLQARQQVAFPIHIKIDTGMHRLGFQSNEIDQLCARLGEAPEVRVKSAFSHLVAAGSEEHQAFTQQQISLFSDSAQQLENALGYSVIKHIANTAGIVDWPSAYMDMVRLGIGLYGVDMSQRMPLEKVSELKTTITQIKELPAGETIGYDRRGVLKRPSRIATVKIGYADGYSRRFGNGVGEMAIHGQRVKTIGSICMDMCMLDVTDIRAEELDEVQVFPDLAEAAARIDTIPYELLVNISARVKRIYFYG